MAETTTTGGWTALFLPSPTPGQIVRFLQRRHRTLPASVPALLLSDAAGPNRLRALTFEGDALETAAYLEAAAPTLVDAFSIPVTLLHLTPEPDSRWNSLIWNPNCPEPDHAEGDNTAPAPAGLLARLRHRPAVLPAIAWAYTRHLPIDRLPALRPPGALSIVDYETVAALDRKNLLIENSPRLYRFPLG